jgi:hypothetical protein
MHCHLRVDLAQSGDFTAAVRVFVWTICAGLLVWSGCAGHRGGTGSFSEIPAGGKASVTLPAGSVMVEPDTTLVGKVAKVNLDGRFVVLTFPIGHLPTAQQRLSVYRKGLKVGEVRVTGPQLDDNVVGDLAAGEAQVGDEVRAQ